MSCRVNNDIREVELLHEKIKASDDDDIYLQ